MANGQNDTTIRRFRAHGGVLRTRDALALGVHPRDLYRLRDEGRLEAISRGVYRLADLPPPSHPDLMAVALRVPRGVICLISALAYYELTNEIPHAVHIALAPHTSAPKLEHPPLRVFRFSKGTLEAGVDEIDLDGVRVRMFSPAKTIADCFRFRNKIGTDVAVDALGHWMARADSKVAELMSYARTCTVERVITPYLEALQ